jgi:hypothetical protein
MRQTDITHWQLAAGEHAEINVIDDHSRLFIYSHAYPGVKHATSWTASTVPQSSTAYPQRCSAISVPCLPADLPHFVSNPPACSEEQQTALVIDPCDEP